MRNMMRTCSVLFLAALGLAAGAAPALAQNQCPMEGSPTDWGFNATGAIMINSGGSCLFSLPTRGEILSSSVAQRPAHGRLQRIDRASYVYTSRPGFRGSDTFAIRATGNSQMGGAGTSVITINATIQ